MPDLSLEAAVRDLVAGIDEAGRGPWAGPVVAAAVILDRHAIPEGIMDSKCLAPARREVLYAQLEGSARIGVGAASVAEIDTLNVLGATLLAMRRTLMRLRVVPALALIDGDRAPALPCAARTVVRGDSRSLSIAAASIVTKVTRDRLMARLAQAHPGFGWERNRGYGTPEHKAALIRLGLTPHHRRSFAPIRELLARQEIAAGSARVKNWGQE